MLFRLSIISIWKLIDPLYYFFSRLHYIKPDQKSDTVFRVRLTKYKGKEIVLSDGTKISKNDMLLKLHLYNVEILKEMWTIENGHSRGRKIFKLVLQSMPILAEYVKKHPQQEKIRGIIGITMIDRGIKHLGFECFEPQSTLYCAFKKYSQLPIYLLSTPDITVRKLKKLKSVYLFMTKETLYQRYQTSK